MPEGPEIRRAADRIAKAIGGATARRVFFAFPHLKEYEQTLRDQTLNEVESRGKALLLHFDGDHVVYTHSQLYGRWFVRRSGTLPRTNRSLRFSVDNGNMAALLYSASQIEVLHRSELDQHPFLAKLGPDVLGRRTSPSLIARRLASKRFAQRRLGGLLLDQQFVAGLGNYLRCEILFVGGLHPQQRPADLGDDRRAELARTIRSLARRAYRTGGATIVGARARSKRRRSERHYVFGRAGRPCPSCGTVIDRITDAGRPCFLCPACQPTRQADGSPPAR